MIKSHKPARYYRNLHGVRNVAKIIISAKTGKENVKGKPYTYKTEKTMKSRSVMGSRVARW